MPNPQKGAAEAAQKETASPAVSAETAIKTLQALEPDPVGESVPVTVKLEKGSTAAGKPYPMFVIRCPEGVIAVRLGDVGALHTIMAHPKVHAIAAGLGRCIVDAASKIPSGRVVISEETF